jgi:hypothetical protein
MSELVVASPIEPAAASSMLAGVERFDPCGIATPDQVAELVHGGQCFAFTTRDGGRCTYVLTVRGRQLCVKAAQGAGGRDLADLVMALAEGQARDAGLSSVSFQTARRGLVRKAEKRGYAVTGYILKKVIS